MRVLNLGAGVQSSVLYLMAVQGELEIDCAIFADTGEEPGAVYRHIEWMQSLGGPPIHIVSSGVLGDDLIRGQNGKKRFASIPAFTHSGLPGSARGQTRRQCTYEYKIRPIEMFIRRELLGLKPRQRTKPGTLVTQLYGISMDEAGRARKIESRMAGTKWLKPGFPLLEKGMTRADCRNWLARYGVPHNVPKSSCVFCPYSSDARWISIRENDPAAWRRAIEIDEAMRSPESACARGLKHKLYLHSSCKPLVEVDFKPQSERDRQLSIDFALECTGMCGL